jgi:WD40 repeat protein
MMLGVGGAGLVASYLQVSQLPARPVVIPAADPARKAPAPSPVDRYGGPLPDRAVSRLGTLRFNHGSDLDRVAFTPDGKSLLSFGKDRIARLWDFPSGRERQAIGGGSALGDCVALSPDGAWLMSSAWNGGGLLHRWDVSTGRELRRSLQPEIRAGVNIMAFSPDGRVLAAASLNDSAAYLWDLEKLGEPRRLRGEEQSIWDIAFSPDARMVATAGMGGIPRGFARSGGTARPDEDPDRGAVRIWDVAAGRENGRVEVTGCHPRCAAFSPDGTTLAASFSDGTVRLYDPAAAREIARLGAQGPMQGCLAFSPDGKVLASGAYPHTTMGGDLAEIRLWDVAGRKESRRFVAHEQLVSGLAFSPDGKVLASAGAEVAIRLWDPTTGREINPSTAHRSGVTCLLVSPVDGSVITGGYDGTVRRWDPTTGREVGRIDGYSRPVHEMAISPDSRLLLSSSHRGMMRLTDLASGRELHRLNARSPGGRAGGLAFAPDGRRATADGKVWDVGTGRELLALQDEQGGAFVPWRPGSVLFTPDARGLIASDGEAARLWDPATGREIRRITARDLSLVSMALSPDGRFLATSIRQDQTIRLWHVATGREVLRLAGHADLACALAFSPDGRLLASGGGEYTRSVDTPVMLWELASGGDVRRFEGHRAGVTAVAFLPDGRRLASSSADATAIVWDIAPSAQTPAASSTPLDLERAWSDLASDVAARAYQAVWTLAIAPQGVVPFVAERLKPARWDDPETDTSLGPLAKDETLRRLRAIAVLEKIGTPEARRMLERIATGLEGARETRDAKAALRRLP